MTVTSGAFLRGVFNQTAALGDKIISSDAYFEIEGAEDLGLLIKQFPWPLLSPTGEIEVPMPMGGVRWQPQQVKINQQGSVALMETVNGHLAAFLERILVTTGARFNATVYEGSPQRFSRRAELHDCFLQLDNPDRDWENRSQIMTISGTLFFHYFGNQ